MKFIIPALAIVTTFNFAYSQDTKIYNNFKRDISFLASDSLEGRLAGSAGEKISAEYISNEFKKAGLKPYKKGTVQTFDIVKLRMATQKCEFKLFLGSEYTDFTRSFTLFEDFFPLSESSNNDSAKGPVVYCGHGIEAENLGVNDYKYLKDLQGKIFAIRVGFPGDDTSAHGPLEPYGALTSKINTAISHGAAGILFIPGSKAAGEPSGELNRTGTTYPLPIFYFRKQMDAEIHIDAKLKSVIAAPTTLAHNVYAYKNNHKKRTVIICAHHDHLGYNEYGNSRYTGPQAIHNGADDNASGVAAMLQLARDLKGRKFRKNNYLFVAFSAEELGLLGSKYFIKNSPVDLKKINYVVNIDMLGRLDSAKKLLIINGTGTSPVWNHSLSKVKTDANLIEIVKSESGLGPSDHASFYLENIPVLHYFTGQHSDYHKPSDDEGKINYAGMVQAYKVILQTIAATNKSKKLEFTKTVDAQTERRQFKVTMGIMPDYAYSKPGLRIDAVSAGKPAAVAGLQAGDVVVQLGNHAIANIQDYTRVLGYYSKGEKTTVTVKRGEELKTFDIEFK